MTGTLVVKAPRRTLRRVVQNDYGISLKYLSSRSTRRLCDGIVLKPRQSMGLGRGGITEGQQIVFGRGNPELQFFHQEIQREYHWIVGRYRYSWRGFIRTIGLLILSLFLRRPYSTPPTPPSRTTTNSTNMPTIP